MAMKVAIFLFIYLLIGQDIIRGQDSVTDEDVNKIFNSLEEYGMNNKKKDKARQYVVLSAANKDELHQLDLVTQRAEVFENNDTGAKLHGELVLLDREEIPEMFRNISRQENKPFIFLYSTYIPCASIGSKKFSCAEELGACASVYNLQNRIFVGYKTLYDKTNKTVAEQFLSNGGIVVYEKQAEVYIKSTLPAAEQFVAHLLQPLFLECLMNWITCNFEVSTLVNVLVRSCLRINTGGRRVTLRSRYLLLNCLKNKSEYMVSKDSETERAMSFCILKSLDKSNAVGKPTENRLECTSWEQGPLNPLTALYEGLRSEHDPAIICEIKPGMSVTKNDLNALRKESDFPEFVTGRIDSFFFTPNKAKKKENERQHSNSALTRENGSNIRHGNRGSRVREDTQKRLSRQ